MDAIITGCSPAGVRARELCIETAKKIGDERRQVEKEDAERRALALSMEAVAAQGEQITGSLAFVNDLWSRILSFNTYYLWISFSQISFITIEMDST